MKIYDLNDIDQVRLGLKHAKQALDGLQWKHDSWCESRYPDPFPCDCRISIAQDKVRTFRSRFIYLSWQSKHRK